MKTLTALIVQMEKSHLGKSQNKTNKTNMTNKMEQIQILNALEIIDEFIKMKNLNIPPCDPCFVIRCSFWNSNG